MGIIPNFLVLLYLPFKQSCSKYIHGVHKVELKVKHNGSTAKCKCCGYIGKTMEFTDIDNLEFRSILTNLIKLYRQCTKNKTYKLNINHTNTIRPHGECSKLTCNYLFINGYLGTLVYIFIETKTLW